MAFGYGYYPTQNYFMPANNAVPDMLNSFKAQYQTPQMPQNPFIWVQGEEAAKAYLVAPNSTVVLWDTEKHVIYIKSADQAGVPTMRILDWAEHAETAPAQPAEHACSCGDKFVLKEDFEALQANVERLTKRIEGTVKPKSKIMKHVEEDEDE